MRQNLDLLEENLVVCPIWTKRELLCLSQAKQSSTPRWSSTHPFSKPLFLCRVMGMLPIQASQAEGFYSKVLTFRGLPETVYKNKRTNKPTVCLPEMLEHWPIWTQTLRVSLWKRKQDRKKQDVNGKPYLQPYFHPQDHNGLLGKFYHQLQSSKQKWQLTPAYDC